jgi:hypothetical protein
VKDDSVPSDERPRPQVKAADSAALLGLEEKAFRLGLSQRLLPDWLAENIDPEGPHYLRAALWHRLSHRPEVSPHLRCELLLQLRDREQVLSLLDVLPQDFEALQPVSDRHLLLAVDRLMATARSVRDCDQEHCEWI